MPAKAKKHRDFGWEYQYNNIHISYLTNILNENLPWFLTVCIFNDKFISKVTERPRKHPIYISRYKLKQQSVSKSQKL